MKTGSITYNGKNSLTDLGIYVTGSGSFDAAELDVDRYEVAGRNGDVIIPKNRYKNIPISYPAFIPKGFDGKVQSVRNWLRSAKTYARLEDTYDVNHFRLGLANGVQSFEPVNRNDASNFQLNFDCKPQRFLKTGETPLPIEPEAHSYSGEIVEFETVAVDDMTKAEVTLSPIQSLNGYDHPWAAGAGKNLFRMDKNSGETLPLTTGSGVTFKVGSDKAIIEATGTASGAVECILSSYNLLRNYITIPAGTYTISVEGLKAGMRFIFSGVGHNGVPYSELTNTDSQKTVAVTDGTEPFTSISLEVDNGIATNATIKIQIEAGTAKTSWTPYENLCPITGHDSATLWDDPKYGGGIEWNQLVDELVQTTTWNGIDITNNGDGSLTLDGEYTGTSTGNLYLTSSTSTLSVISGHKYYINLHNANVPQAPVRIGNSAGFGTLRSGATISSPASSVTGRLDYRIAVGKTLSNLKVYPQVFDLTQMFGEEVADYIFSLEAANYGDGVNYVLNLFPKNYYAYNAGEDSCVSKVNGDPYREYPATFPQTVYGGTFDWVSGKLKVTMANIASYNGETIGEPWLSSMDAYVAGATPTTGAQVVHTITTTETTLTPAQVQTLLGLNNVWSDGTVEVNYADPFNVDNPTYYASRPLFEITNPAQNDVLNVNGKTITFLSGYTGTVTIDCETMDAYSSSGTNLNYLISATDFPVLNEGVNIVTWSGSGSCKMTPRWWEL